MRKALIVVDMQNDFIEGTLGTKEAVDIVENVVDKIKTFDGEYIFVTKDTHFENYLDTMEGRKLPVSHCIKGTKGWNLNKKVQEALVNKKNIEVIEKLTFGSEQLAEKIKQINDQGTVAVELIGLCTDICVVSNALLIKAKCPEMDILVDSSCCAGVSKESHEAALTTMGMCQITII